MGVQEFRQHASEVTRGFSPESVKDLVLRYLAEDMETDTAIVGKVSGTRKKKPVRNTHVRQSPGKL
jgi:hypothetical protein